MFEYGYTNNLNHKRRMFMKKVLVVLIALFAVLFPSCSEENGGSSSDVIKIAVAETTANDEIATRKRYLEEYIAPHYNVEFMFSESLEDSGALIDFITNAADSGCVALIDCSTQDYIGAARECAKYGMYYAYNGEMYPEFEQGQYDNVVGAWGQNQQATAELFAQYLRETATATGEEGFCILSVNAPQGNTASKTIGSAALEAIADLYDFEYDEPVEDLIISSTPIEAKNSKGIKVYIYPGQLNADTLPGLQAVLQSGDYGYLIGTVQTYTSTAVVVDEIERATGKNIKVMSPASMTDSLLTAYRTQDVFGNPTLDFVTIKAASAHGAVLFALVYNAITGHADADLQNGQVRRFTFGQFPLTDLEMVETASSWDNPDTGTWVCDYSFVDSMLAEKNPDLTSDDIQAAINANLTYDSIYARLEGSN